MTSLAHQARMPLGTECLLDARGEARALVVRWEHDEHDEGVVVLSLWRGAECAGTFWLQRDDVPDLISSLATGLAATTR